MDPVCVTKSDLLNRAYHLTQEASARGRSLMVRDAQTAIVAALALSQQGLNKLTLGNIADVPPRLRQGARVMLRVLAKTKGQDHAALIAELSRLDEAEAKKQTGWTRAPKPFESWRAPHPRGVMSRMDWQQKACATA